MTNCAMSWAVGFATGLVFGARICWILAVPRERDPDWRRSFNHENTNRPSGPPPLKLRRSGDPDAILPTTPKPNIVPKPQFPPPRIIREDFLP